MKKLLIIPLFIALFFASCSVKSPEDYYNSTESGEYTATITINCQTAVDYSGSERKKADILTGYSVGFNDGDTVFDALKNACKANKIQFEHEGSGSSVYISGIDYLYEFDCGDLSGWEFSVNGEFPGVGCNAVELHEGDKIDWLYTCNLGADIGNVYKGD